MTMSIWRYSHLVLAIVASLFLLVASVTGCILAVEPISHQAKAYSVQDLDQVSLATTVEALKTNYDEVFSMEVESSGFVKASVLTHDLETLEIYINPNTGEQLGEVAERSLIYSFATNLHRSLFLKSVGRFIVGLVSLLLFLIAVTGFLLLAKRQGGIKRMFSKVQKEYFEMRYHVILSRWLFIPILIITLTGVYLSAEKFKLLPDVAITYKEVPQPETASHYEALAELPILKNTTLDEVRKMDFPFSNDPEDYFHLALQNKEVQVNQQTGAIVSSASYPFVMLASRLSLGLHTGEGSVLWSLILFFASGSILFFMYSGFVMAWKRRKKVDTPAVMADKDESEFIILVGSETGTTSDFARRFYNALTGAGKKVFLTDLNKYSSFAKAKHLIIFTATYGEGEAPTSARKFEKLFLEIQQPNPINYAVIGFGSLEYPDYCQFAIAVNDRLQASPGFQATVPLYKINNSNFASFEAWVSHWSREVAISLHIERPASKKRKLKKLPFTVVERSAMNVDDTFMVRLKPNKKVKFTSGDLLSVFPEGTKIARQYSIARMGEEIVLSVKKHQFGLGSSYLYTLKVGAILEAAIETNRNFHFPKKVNSAVLIANGTGIAPFLGMLEENKNTQFHLFWGGRTQASSAIYDRLLEKEVLKKRNVTIHKCFSREANCQYVQHLVTSQKKILLENLQNGGACMICGSLAMQHDVLNSMEEVLKGHSTISLDEIELNGQLKMDCY